MKINSFFLVISVVLVIFLSFLHFAEAITPNPIPNSWTTKTPLPEARGGVGTAVVNEKIYAIGGSATSFNEEYDPVADKWIARAPLPTPTGYFAIASYKSKIYCFGGITGSSDYGYTLTAANQVYDTITDKWETKASMPTAKCYLQAEVVNGRIYLIGGSKGFGFTLTDDVMVYNPETNVWSKSTSIPSAVASYASGVLDNKIYVVNSSLNQIYDIRKDIWSIGTSPPLIGKISSGGATSGYFAPQRFYLFGEKGSANYDSQTNTWTKSASLPTYRSYSSAALLNDIFYVIGGFISQAAIEPSSNLPTYFQPHTTLTTINEEYVPIGYGTSDPSVTIPKIEILSPENITYTSTNIPLVFTLDKPTNWVKYSLDEHKNVTVLSNVTLSGVSSGLHSLMVYANDTYGNIGTTETVSFIIKSERFPIGTVATVSATIAVVISIVIGVYLKKYNQTCKH
jgi:hypothetical protein